MPGPLCCWGFPLGCLIQSGLRPAIPATARQPTSTGYWEWPAIAMQFLPRQSVPDRAETITSGALPAYVPNELARRGAFPSGGHAGLGIVLERRYPEGAVACRRSKNAWRIWKGK